MVTLISNLSPFLKTERNNGAGSSIQIEEKKATVNYECKVER